MRAKQSKAKTLDRILSQAGIASRTEARSWIAAGRVAINGKTSQSPDVWVDLKRDRVTVDGRPVTAREKVYLLLYKPKGYLTSYKDPEGRRTVYDLLPGAHEWIFPVGRLDLDTSGLLILTNDTAFGDFITSPDSKVPKTYLVKSSMMLTDAQLDQLRQGIELADGPTRSAMVSRVRDSAKYTFFEITITEGRNRQVRRMVEALGAKVLKLVRTAIGGIEIGGLEIGKHRELTRNEVKGLSGLKAGPIQHNKPIRHNKMFDANRLDANHLSGDSGTASGSATRPGGGPQEDSAGREFLEK